MEARVSSRSLKKLCLAAAVVVTPIFLIVVSNSLAWIGKSFPGFLVMGNRVVASVALPDWPDPSTIFQHEVIAVDGRAMPTSAEIYAYVAAKPGGTPVVYTVRAADGTVRKVWFPVRVFTQADYALLLGAFLINGAAFLCIAFVVFYLKPRSPAAHGLLATSLCTGLFVTTAVDLYAPHVFFRLHVAAEGMASAAFLHLALVFPTDRIKHCRGRALAALYGTCALFVLLYEGAIWDPPSYTAMHLIASGGFGACTIGIVLSILFDLATSRSVIVRRRIAVVALGSLGGVLPTTLLWAFSGVNGGKVAINAVAMTAFLFPLSIAYAIIKRDLFEIDRLLQRALTYGLVMLAISGMYFLVLFLFGVLVPGRELLWRSPVALAVLNLGLLFSITPLRDRAQQVIDRFFFRQRYDIETGLSELGHRLATARALESVFEHTKAVIGATVSPTHCELYLQKSGDEFVPVAADGGPSFHLPEHLLGRIRRGERIARYEFEDEAASAAERDLWERLGCEVLLPLRADGAPHGLIALGAKRSGRVFSAHDMSFLDTAANQISLAVANAFAFDRLEHLNESLEEQVIERTAKLHDANTQLNRSLGQLQEAYRELEKNQASLLRADRLATLGRLTAGLAHEINTPLSAVLNALKILEDLGGEYEASIDDTTVLPDDHREIAREIVSTSRAAATWGNRAAAYVRSVKSHGRESRRGEEAYFRVREVVDSAQSLVAHRLRAALCKLEVDEQELDVELSGDPGRLGQVLVNLVTNAIDAYEEKGIRNGSVELHIRRADESTVSLEVRDQAGGFRRTCCRASSTSCSPPRSRGGAPDSACGSRATSSRRGSEARST